MLRSEEWEGLLDWLRGKALADGRIGEQDFATLHVVDDPSEVCAIVESAHRRRREQAGGERRRTAAHRLPET
jgi:predicted Rossmann-fold nucleotide-binding protein